MNRRRMEAAFRLPIASTDGHFSVEARVRPFLTDLVNGILLIKSNPDSKGERKAEATAKRDAYRSLFNYLWRSLLAGLKKTIVL